jgi:hypothetical protein
MSADKHRRLAIDVAYLRLAAGGHDPENPLGFSVNIKWGRALTPEIQDLIAKGDVVLQRSGGGGRCNTTGRKRTSKRVTMVVATAQGRARLAATLQRHGADFGPVAKLARIEPVRIRKEDRRKAASKADPVARRAARARLEATLAILRARQESAPERAPLIVAT